MDVRSIETVRRFNRSVTQRIGALDEAFLARGRSLGHSRVLWEIGPEGATLRDLRARLDLDSGYLTRIVQSLESAGLIRLHPTPGDARSRTAELTDAGREERDELDRLSDAQAEGLLTPLTPAQRERLVAAMETVERLLDASTIELTVVEPSDPRAREAIGHYAAELARRFDGGFAVNASLPLSDEALRPPAGLLLVALRRDRVLGCGGLKLLPGAVGEIKRLWIAPEARGFGLGRRILADLEHRAREHGCETTRLDTNRVLTEAIALYRSSGYREVPAFNDEPYAHHWFEKTLSPSAGDGREHDD